MNLPDLPIHDPVLIFAVVMLIILIVPIVSGKLRIPSILGLIVAGAITGPGALGLLERDDTLILLGTVGLLYLMFIAGLSMDLEKFSKTKDKSIIFGIFSFGLPALGTILLVPWLLGFSFFSALLVASIVGSHTLLAYPIANRLGIGKNRAVTMSLGATMVTDALSLTLLAIVAATIHGDLNTAFWITFSGSVLIYLGVVIFTLPRLGRWFFRNVKDKTNVEYVFLLSVLFVTAYIAQEIGLAAIIGAFLAGLTMNRLVPENSILMSRVQFIGNALFIPFFLISVGMLVDIRVLTSLEVWIIALTFLFLVTAGKFFASKIVQYLFKLEKEEGWVMFGLTTPQAAATLAVTLIGFDLGLFDETAVNAVVLLILATCFLGPYLVDIYGRLLFLREEKAPLKASDAPERILIPLSNPETSEALMDIAILIRGKNSTEPLFPLTVARETLHVEEAVASGEKMLGQAVIHAAAADMPVIPVTRVDLNIASGIIRATRELRISDIVIGWNGVITTRQRIFGTILDQILEQSDETILVSKIDQPINTMERVILAIPPMIQYESGFSESFQTIKKLIHQLGVKLVVLSTESNHELLKSFLETQEPKLSPAYEKLSHWKSLITAINGKIKKDDLLILFGSRRGSISWQAALDRLPAKIISQVKPDNLIITYSAEIKEESDSSMVLRLDDSPLMPDISTKQIYIATEKEKDYIKVLEKLVTGIFPDRTDVTREIIQKLSTIHPNNLPDDLPGVVLKHLSTHYLEKPTLLLAVNKNGFYLKNLENPVNILFLLFSPTHLSFQRNLLILNRIGRLIGKEEVRKRLAGAENLDDIKKTLSARLTITTDEDAASQQSSGG